MSALCLNDRSERLIGPSKTIHRDDVTRCEAQDRPIDHDRGLWISRLASKLSELHDVVRQLRTSHVDTLPRRSLSTLDRLNVRGPIAPAPLLGPPWSTGRRMAC